MRLDRCLNPKNKSYPYYGGCGVSVCEEWLNFEPFLISMDDDSEAFPTFQHEGMQFIYMLEGLIDYRHGQYVYRLEPGDSFTFDAEVPHGPETLVQVPIRFLAVTVFDSDTA